MHIASIAAIISNIKEKWGQLSPWPRPSVKDYSDVGVGRIISSSSSSTNIAGKPSPTHC